MSESVMDRLYYYYTQHLKSLNQHASMMPERFGGSADFWKLKMLKQGEFEESLQTRSRNPAVKVAWLRRILCIAEESERKWILEEVSQKLDSECLELLVLNSRHAA